MLHDLTVRNACVSMFAFATICVSALPSAASANDGGIAFGGSPGLLKGHPSISMTSELIRITVGEKRLTTDCSFVFTNRGKACSVRMGFPDRGFGASNPDEEGSTDDLLHTPPKSTFDSFRSYVDGREVNTKLIRANKPGEYWHTKTVAFTTNGVRRIRDVYTQSVGGGIVDVGGKTTFASQIGYILHTGASWHGKIGRTEIVVVFQSRAIPSNVKPIAVSRVSKKADARRLVRNVAPNAVVWTGPCAPTASGRTLRFVRVNWRPKVSDDVELTYGYRRLKPESTGGR